MSHTPGPWEVATEFRGLGGVVASLGQNLEGEHFTVRASCHVPDAALPANARLIALAPEMWDLLTTFENDTGMIPEWLWDRIQALKAKGATP